MRHAGAILAGIACKSSKFCLTETMHIYRLVAIAGLACNIRVYKSPSLETSFAETGGNNGPVTAREYRCLRLCACALHSYT